MPAKAPLAVKEIIEDARLRGEWNVYNLMPYSTDTLRKSMEFLDDNDLYPALQKAIKNEIRKREENSMDKRLTANLVWFPTYWWAVMSLFGKGDMDKDAPQTKAILAKIDPNWRNNCGGRDI